MRRSLRRIQQFFRATFARVHPDEIAAIQDILTPAQVALFRRMAHSDQRHSLDVLHTLRQAGHQDKSLLQAALLHDASKSVFASSNPAKKPSPLQRLTVWHRSLVVLLQGAAPGWLTSLAADGRGWRKPFATHVRHAQASAALAAQAGCAPEVVALIRRHHEHKSAVRRDDDQRLALLQWADEQN